MDKGEVQVNYYGNECDVWYYEDYVNLLWELQYLYHTTSIKQASPIEVPKGHNLNGLYDNITMGRNSAMGDYMVLQHVTILYTQ